MTDKEEYIRDVIKAYNKHNTEENKGGKVVSLILPEAITNMHPRMTKETIGNTQVCNMYWELGTSSEEEIREDIESFYKENK